jgi:hypothetical protein
LAKVKTGRLHKTLAALAVALFFAFGVVAVSSAHDVSATGPIHAFQLRHRLKDDPVQLDAYWFTFELADETANSSSSGQPDLWNQRLFLPPYRADRAIFSGLVPPPKVSFQILESVLLI